MQIQDSCLVAINNRLKYKKMNKQYRKVEGVRVQSTLYTIQFKSSQLENIIIKMNPNQKDQLKKKNSAHKEQESYSSSSQGDEELDDFIVDDEEDQEDGYGYRGDYSDGEQKDKKSKKHKKKDKKKKKEKRRKQQEESYDEDDLELIDDDQKLTRLKKKKEPRREEDYDDEDGNAYDLGDDEVPYDEDAQSDDDAGYQLDQDESDPLSVIQEVIQQQKDIFDPSDIRLMTVQNEDIELVDLDLPQRYIAQLKIYARNARKPLLEIKEGQQNENRSSEAEWIYFKLKAIGLLQSYEEKECKQRIRQVLECLHQQHLDLMYIFLYRKKIYSDYLNMEILWKVYQLDEEWFIYRQKQKKCADYLQYFLPSLTQVPQQLVEYADQCPQLRTLKYFDDFMLFAQAKWSVRSEPHDKTTSKKLSKLNFVTQISSFGVAQKLEESSIFLSPQLLCYNLKARAQDKKPKTPQNDPKSQFQRMIKSVLDSKGIYREDEKQAEMKNYPLLVGENVFKSITKYLCYELFAYPELRRILKDRYFKKLIISTNPTKKGTQDIDLYSMYFPVKRIKQKPISILKREVWILAQQAVKLGLITIDMRFQWESPNADKSQRENRDRDSVYMELARYYFEIGNKSTLDIWNFYRKRIITGFLNDFFLPHLLSEVKEELTKEGEKEIINACVNKLRQQLNKGPSLKQGKPIKILSMVLEETKLGIAFVDESGKSQFSFHIVINNDEELRRFVGDENLSIYIKEYKPDMILIAANCKRAQTLRKELRDPKLFSQSIFCAFGEYQVPRLVAKKRIIQGHVEEQCILQAISMARLKKNPLAEIVSLWSDKLIDNGLLSMNLHQYQNFVSQKKLIDSLEKVIVEVVNMVGIDINQLCRNEHLQSQLQFISGLGPKKAFSLLQKFKESNAQILSRKRLEQMIVKPLVAKNCLPFIKIQTSLHKALFEKIEKQKKPSSIIKEYQHINMLDMTRIPDQWYPYIFKKVAENYKTVTLTEMRSKKAFAKLSDENIAILQIFKNPERTRGIQWKFKDCIYFDEQMVKAEFLYRFKNPRDPQRVMQNRQIFFHLLRQTPDTLKRYMIMQVRVLSVKKNYLNVIIPENGLFGYIKLQGKTPEEIDKYEKIYEKGTTIKAVIIGFPFDQKTFRDQPSEQQELLKIEMALDFPHKDNDRHDGSRHDCMLTCFPAIVKEIHPIIDLEKDRFDLRKEDRPVLEVRQQKFIPKNIKADFRRISHPKFKNISAVPAIDMMKESGIGDFVIRPSSQGQQYLTITWNFFKGVIVHIKVKCEHKTLNSMNVSYRIEDKDNRSYNSLQQIIEKCLKPMNIFVQDVTSNKKFLNQPIEQIQNLVKRQTAGDSSRIYYYFAVTEEYPQFFLLIYMYKDKKPIRELIKVKSSGLYFHEQQFSNIKDLITWFKEHLKEKEYQKYVKNATQIIQRMK